MPDSSDNATGRELDVPSSIYVAIYRLVKCSCRQFVSHIMSATLFDIKCVQMDGLKTVAKFPVDDQVVCDGSVFIRLNPRNTSLVALVCEDNDAPGIP